VAHISYRDEKLSPEQYQCVRNTGVLIFPNVFCLMIRIFLLMLVLLYINTRVGTLIVATIYLQLIQNRYMVRSFTVLQFSHQHCAQPVASDVEVVEYF